MHGQGQSTVDEGRQARWAGAGWLGQALVDSRRDTLATFAAYERALGPALQVPLRDTLNPPRWELGHIGWFQEYWLARNAERARGVDADPDCDRPDSVRPGADALYHSSRVAHDLRWSLPLPDADATRADLAAQLESTLALLALQADDDRSLYFFRLALLHEDMHHEAALYMARSLDIPVVDPRWQPRPSTGDRRPLGFDPCRHRIGGADGGFAFDNELPGRKQRLEGYEIDRRVVTWDEYLPFVEAGGYADARWWSDDGRRWLEARRVAAPCYLRRDGGQWFERRGAGWRPLDRSCAAEHLSAYEAQAWCRWAGRRLPSEAEWEHAALAAAGAIEWGAVWEWTASAFEPFDGFVAHPYRDYSRPWFDGRPVLRGASYLTQPRMRWARYRNFFAPHRTDIPAGFRTCRSH